MVFAFSHDCVGYPDWFVTVFPSGSNSPLPEDLEVQHPSRMHHVVPTRRPPDNLCLCWDPACLASCGVWNEQCRRLALQALKLPNAEYRDDGASAVKWVQLEGDWGGLEIQHQHLVKFVAWHAQGDYFATVSPDGHSKVGVINKCV